MEIREDQKPPGTPKKTPVVDLLAFLGRPHMLTVIFHAGPNADGAIRFNRILESSGVPRNTLVTRLRELVEAGLLERAEYDEIPPRVEYQPTQKLIDLIPAFKAMHKWGDRYALASDSRLGAVPRQPGDGR